VPASCRISWREANLRPGSRRTWVRVRGKVAGGLCPGRCRSGEPSASVPRPFELGDSLFPAGIAGGAFPHTRIRQSPSPDWDSRGRSPRNAVRREPTTPKGLHKRLRLGQRNRGLFNPFTVGGQARSRSAGFTHGYSCLIPFRKNGLMPLGQRVGPPLEKKAGAPRL